MNYCIDLIPGKAFCIFIFFHFPGSRLSVLKGFRFYFCFLTRVKTGNRLPSAHRLLKMALTTTGGASFWIIENKVIKESRTPPNLHALVLASIG